VLDVVVVTLHVEPVLVEMVLCVLEVVLVVEVVDVKEGVSFGNPTKLSSISAKSSEA
jgi:hypothetical protein